MATTVRDPGQKPLLWYRPRCFGLSAKVKRPAWRTPQRSNCLEPRAEQLAPDAAIPEIRVNAERPEDGERTPTRHEHRPHELVFDLGDPRTRWLGSKPRSHHLAIAEGGARIWKAANRSERQPHHPVGCVDVALVHRSNARALLEPHISPLERHPAQEAAGTRSSVDPGTRSRSWRFASATSRFRRAMRACSRAIASARAPSR